MKPFVSVIIPSFNRAHCVLNAVKTVQEQENADVEIIVVDDASTDNTRAVLSSAAFVDPRIRIVRHDENKGVSAARNTGIREAKGDYIAFLDSDDHWAFFKLSLQFEAIKKSRVAPENLVCLSYYLALHDAIDRGDEVELKTSIPKIFGWRDAADTIFLKQYSQKEVEEGIITRDLWFGIGSTLFAHRSAIEKNGFFRENIGHGEDTEYVTRHLARGGRATVVPELLMLYKMPEDDKKYRGEKDFLCHMLNMYPDQIFKHFPKRVTEYYVDSYLQSLARYLTAEKQDATISDLAACVNRDVAFCVMGYGKDTPLKTLKSEWCMGAARIYMRMAATRAKYDRLAGAAPKLKHAVLGG